MREAEQIGESFLELFSQEGPTSILSGQLSGRGGGLITEACVPRGGSSYVWSMMIKVLSDTALLVESSTSRQVDALDWVTRAAAAIRKLRDPGVSEVVPALNAIGVHLKPQAHWASAAINMYAAPALNNTPCSIMVCRGNCWVKPHSMAVETSIIKIMFG